jgi:hypothetical protein
LSEAHELFTGWDEHPPTNLLVKAIVEGLGGQTQPKANDVVDVPPEAMLAMQRSAAQAVVAKAGSRLPMVHGRDKGLPSAQPVFDIEEMRRRNADVTRRRAQMKDEKRV